MLSPTSSQSSKSLNKKYEIHKNSHKEKKNLKFRVKKLWKEKIKKKEIKYVHDQIHA